MKEGHYKDFFHRNSIELIIFYSKKSQRLLQKWANIFHKLKKNEEKSNKWIKLTYVAQYVYLGCFYIIKEKETFVVKELSFQRWSLRMSSLLHCVDKLFLLLKENCLSESLCGRNNKMDIFLYVYILHKNLLVVPNI